VVGGGVAGLKAAQILANRGHEIVVFEKQAVLGGQINILKLIPFRNEFSEVIRYLEYVIKAIPTIKIKLSVDADIKKVKAEQPDVVVVATGALASVPDAIKNRKAVTTWDVLEGKAIIGKKVLVYDPFSANEGVGIVEYLFDNYKDIEIHYMTPKDGIAMNSKNENKDIMLRKLLRMNLKITQFMALVKADNEKLTFQKVFTTQEHNVADAEFDNFIYVGNMRSIDDLFWKLKQDHSIAEVYRVGDAKAPACVEIAIHDAEALARSI